MIRKLKLLLYRSGVARRLHEQHGIDPKISFVITNTYADLVASGFDVGISHDIIANNIVRDMEST